MNQVKGVSGGKIEWEDDTSESRVSRSFACLPVIFFSLRYELNYLRFVIFYILPVVLQFGTFDCTWTVVRGEKSADTQNIINCHVQEEKWVLISKSMRAERAINQIESEMLEIKIITFFHKYVRISPPLVNERRIKCWIFLWIFIFLLSSFYRIKLLMSFEILFSSSVFTIWISFNVILICFTSLLHVFLSSCV